MTNLTRKFDLLRARCESTPFLSVDLGDKARIELYWSRNVGSMGYQVHTVIYNFLVDCDDVNRVLFSKSNGYGYSKEDSELELALCHLSLFPKGMSIGGASIPYDYRVGGNYYKVPNSKLLKRKPNRARRGVSK